MSQLHIYDNNYDKWASLEDSSDDGAVEEPPKPVSPPKPPSPSRLFELGFDHYVGRNGRSKDATEAARIWGLAADRGNGRAQTSLAQLYYNGDGVRRKLRRPSFARTPRRIALPPPR